METNKFEKHSICIRFVFEKIQLEHRITESFVESLMIPTYRNKQNDNGTIDYQVTFTRCDAKKYITRITEWS